MTTISKGKGDAWLHRRHYKKASEAFRQALRLDPDDSAESFSVNKVHRSLAWLPTYYLSICTDGSYGLNVLSNGGLINILHYSTVSI